MKNKLTDRLYQSPLSIFFFIITLELGIFFIFQVLLPGGQSGSRLFGLSTSRLIILAASLLAFGLSGCLLMKSTGSTTAKILSTLLNHIPLLVWSGLLLVAFTTFYFFIPESGLRGAYPSVFTRTDPFVFLFSLLTVEFLAMLFFEKRRQSTPEEWHGFARTVIESILTPVLVFFFPFVYLFPRTIPINGEFYGVANDFIPTSYTYKVYLLDCLSKFHFPLWSPAESAGYPFFSNPFSQSFYPLNIPLTGLYIINRGYSILDNQRYAVLGIAIFAVGLYFWLRKFSLSTRAIFIVSLIIPVSYRLAELIRYPSGLHSIAWYPWILLALTNLASARSFKQTAGNVLLLVYSGISLVAGGYQYYLFYSVFLIIPYMILLCVPVFRKRFFPESQPVRWVNFAVIAASGIAVVLIAGPYALRMARLISMTSSRGGGDFSFSTTDDFSIIDTLGSLVYPPVSQAEGWYFFGFASVVLVLVFLVSRPWFKKETWASADGGKTWKYWFLNPWVAGSLCVFYVLITYITYGKSSYLFIFLWKYFPFFSHLRFIGRLNVVLLPVIGLLLAISIDFFTQVVKSILDRGIDRFDLARKWTGIIISVCVFLAGIQVYLFEFQKRDIYWVKYLASFSGKEKTFLILSLCVILFFALTCLFLVKRRLRPISAFWLIFTTLVLVDMWPMSAFMWWNGTHYVSDDQRKPAEIVTRVFRESFDHRRDPTYNENAISLTPTYRVNYSDDWYFSFYRDFYFAHEAEPKARERLLGVTDGQRVFFSRSIAYTDITDYFIDADGTAFDYKIREFNGDRLELDVEVPEDGYISYIDNWDPDWKAYVNGHTLPVEKLFSTFKAVKVSRGKSQVVFSYEPDIFGLSNWRMK